MALHYRLDTLLMYDPTRARTTTNVWVARPTPLEEQTLGKLFVLTALEGPARVNHDVIGLIQEELKNRYYQAVDFKVERAFEQALQQTNQRLHELIAEGVASWVDRANILVGVIRQQQVMLSFVGGMHAFVIRKERLHDIIGQPERSAPNPLRLFSNVIAGQLLANDRLLFCTPTLLDYFSMEKLRRTVLDHTPSEAVRTLETNLLGVENQAALAAVVMHFEATVETAVPASQPLHVSPLARTAPQVSMEELIARERATEQLLAPSIWPAVKDFLGQLSQAGNRAFRATILRKPPKRRPPVLEIAERQREEEVTGVPRRPSRLWPNIRSILVQTPAVVMREVRHLTRRRPKIETSNVPVLPMRRRPSAGIQQLIIWVQRLPRTQQLLLSAAGILVLVLVGSIVKNGTGSTPTTSNPTQTASSVQDNLNLAQAALLYGGETTAIDRLNDAVAAFAKLPQRNAKERQTKQQLQQQIDQLTAKVNHMTVVSNPKVFASLSSVATNIQPRQLYLLKDSVVAFDPSSGVSATVPLKSPDHPVVSQNHLDTGSALTGTANTLTSVVFTTDRGAFLEFDAAKQTWLPFDAKYPVTNPHVQAIAVFQSRLYALETTQSDIFRFTKNGPSYGQPVAWLKETAHFQQARDVAVDGSIFVLEPRGVVEVYNNGRRTSFGLATITPTLDNPTRLWTSTAAQHLYLVDPDQHRIVVFDKTGKIVDQYSSPTWTSLRAAVADEKTKKLYVLDGTNVYSVPLLH